MKQKYTDDEAGTLTNEPLVDFLSDWYKKRL
jgi:hypothetical protein